MQVSLCQQQTSKKDDDGAGNPRARFKGLKFTKFKATGRPQQVSAGNVGRGHHTASGQHLISGVVESSLLFNEDVFPR